MREHIMAFCLVLVLLHPDQLLLLCLQAPLRLAVDQWIPHKGVSGALAAKGVTQLYPWQAAALESGEDGSNLVYCAPTSGVCDWMQVNFQ